MVCHHHIKASLLNKTMLRPLVTTGIHFVGGCNFYSLFLQHFQLNAWATGSLATDSAMMQDWRGTDLQFHSAGEDKLASVSCCSSSKPLQLTVIKETASHLTSHKTHKNVIKANTMFFCEYDIKVCFAFWQTDAKKYQCSLLIPP